VWFPLAEIAIPVVFTGRAMAARAAKCMPTRGSMGSFRDCVRRSLNISTNTEKAAAKTTELAAENLRPVPGRQNCSRKSGNFHGNQNREVERPI
jgi:hypothetical protein